jgi:raffinose/stachyose/melibiose transport system substrate-binding protein
MPTKPITLTYWDATGLYLSDQGAATLDKEFMAKYPNIKVVRVPKAFATITSTERLAASGPNAPDVIVTNGGYVLLGPLVQAGLVLPLDKWAAGSGWDTRFTPQVLDQFRFSSDGSRWGVGSLYALPAGASFIGLYYDKALLTKLGLQIPTNWAQFLGSLKTAKKAGIVPLAAGVQDGWPVVHMYTSIQDDLTPTSQINAFEFHAPNATFNTPQNLRAAELAVQLVKDGYYSPNFLGQTSGTAIAQFAAGKALYYIQGTYFSGPIYTGLGDKAGMTIVPPMTGEPFSATGGPGLGYAISAKSQNPQAAACFIDFRTGPQAAKLFVGEGGLPAMNYTYTGNSTFIKSMFGAWAKASKSLVPYLDFATPNLLTVLTSTIQELLGSKITPTQFVQQVQQAYTQFRP